MLVGESHPIPIDAQCWVCGYPLRELSECRCSECGRSFDPADSQTMYLGRPRSAVARVLILPISKAVNVCLNVECFGLFWFTAGLPLAPIVAAVVGISLPLTLIYVFFRRVIRWMLLRRHPRALNSLPPPYRWPRWVTTLFLILSLLGGLVHPARIPLWLCRPWIEARCRYLYEGMPLLETPHETGFYGLFWINEARVEPSGVELRTWSGGPIICYNEPKGLYLRHVAPPPALAVVWISLSVTGLDHWESVRKIEDDFFYWMSPDGLY